MSAMDQSTFFPASEMPIQYVAASPGSTKRHSSVLMTFAGPSHGSTQMNSRSGSDQNWRCRNSGEKASLTRVTVGISKQISDARGRLQANVVRLTG